VPAGPIRGLATQKGACWPNRGGWPPKRVAAGPIGGLAPQKGALFVGCYWLLLDAQGLVTWQVTSSGGVPGPSGPRGLEQPFPIIIINVLPLILKFAAQRRFFAFQGLLGGQNGLKLDTPWGGQGALSIAIPSWRLGRS
jgi:hypothetical protein